MIDVAKNGATQEEVKAFHEYGNEPEFDSVDEGLYQLEVTGHDLYEGDAGVQLQINTRIVGGEHDGKMGPAKFLDPNARTFVARGKEVTVGQEKARRDFYYAVKHIHNDEELELTASDFGEDMLGEVGHILTGDVFIGKVTVRDNGRNALGAVYPLSSPPQKWRGPGGTGGGGSQCGPLVKKKGIQTPH